MPCTICSRKYQMSIIIAMIALISVTGRNFIIAPQLCAAPVVLYASLVVVCAVLVEGAKMGRGGRGGVNPPDFKIIFFS